jgi:chaperonin GroES
MISAQLLVNSIVLLDCAFRHETCYPQAHTKKAFQTELEEKSMKIRPLGDRIVIRRFEAQEKTAGGILLPDTAKNKPQKGKVLHVGPGRLLKDGTRQPLQVKEGDVVLFTNWAGDEFKESRGENILLMREEDVLAVLEE